MEKLNLIGAQPFATKRCSLRQFKNGDEEYIFKNWASSEKVARYVTWYAHKSIDDSRDFCRYTVEKSKNLDNFDWMIELNDLGEPIGSIGVVSADTEKREAELGWVIGEKWWNKGIMTECAEAVIAYLIFVVGFDKLTASHITENAASGRVMEKCGMTRQLARTRHLDIKNIDVETAEYTITKAEWYAKNIKLK